ncbi:MAG: WD40 repeat domain-containing protein [Acidobacteria bacterium]|nr:WD40 repeat domain-containing protein [Acidobacteriota bacterium]
MLLAKWIDRQRARSDSGLDLRIHFRFIGASDNSNNVDPVLRSVLLELRASGALSGEIPEDPVRLRSILPEMLRAAGENGPTVIVIDGLNQLETGLRDLGWLPKPLPATVKLVISFKLGEPEAEAFYRRCEESTDFEVFRVEPFADPNDRRRLVSAYLSQYLKELDADHLHALVSLPGADNPLYLKVVLSELRVFGVHANLGERIEHDFGSDPVSGLDAVLRRLETDPAYTRLEPRQIVRLVFGLLAHARRGLSVDELSDLILLAHSPAERAAFGSTAASPPRITRDQARDAVNLYLRQVRPFLMRRVGRYGFLYESFKVAALRRYVHGPATPGVPSGAQWYARLARYFAAQPLVLEAPGGVRQPNVRKVDELPWQQTHGELWDELRDTLCDLEFVEAKCLASLTYDLVQDYALAAQSHPADRMHADLEAFGRFVVAHAHIFSRDARQVVPFAYNHASDGPVVRAAERHLDRRGWGSFSCVQLADRPEYVIRSAAVRTLDGHRGPVTSVAMSADGTMLVSGASDGTIKFWEVTTGVTRRTIDAHAGGIGGVAITTDGRWAASAGADENVRIWDVESGAVKANLWKYQHWGAVKGVRLSDDGAIAVSAGEDGRVRVWDVDRAELRFDLRGHFGPVNSVDMTRDGRIAVTGGWDGSVRMWDIGRGALLRSLDGHTVSVQDVAISAAGSVVASSGGMPAGATGTKPRGLFESDVRFWTSDGRCFYVGTAHEVADRGGRISGVLGSTVHAVAMTEDAKFAVSGGYDRRVWLWDVAVGRPLRSFVGHSDSVLAAAIDDSGTIAATGGADCTIRIWDLRGKTPPEFSLRRRIGAVGTPAPSSLAERALLMLANRRLQLWVAVPIWAALLGWVAHRLLVEAGVTYPLYRSPVTMIGLAATSLYWVRWQWSLAAPREERRLGRLLPAAAIAASLPLLPLGAFFGVFNCPVCGRRVCGRRYLFHCSSCRWQDAGGELQRRIMAAAGRLVARHRERRTRRR